MSTYWMGSRRRWSKCSPCMAPRMIGSAKLAITTSEAIAENNGNTINSLSERKTDALAFIKVQLRANFPMARHPSPVGDRHFVAEASHVEQWRGSFKQGALFGKDPGQMLNHRPDGQVLAVLPAYEQPDLARGW